MSPVICLKCKYPVSLARCYKCEPWDIKKENMSKLVRKSDSGFLGELTNRLKLHRRDYPEVKKETLLEVMGMFSKKEVKLESETERSLIIATLAMRLHSEEYNNGLSSP